MITLLRHVLIAIFRFLINISINILTPNTVLLSARLNHKIFLQLIKRKLKKINFRDVYLGHEVTLNDGCSFYNHPEIFGKVHLGKFVSISGPSTRISSKLHSIYIGNYCSIASNVIIQVIPFKP